MARLTSILTVVQGALLHHATELGDLNSTCDVTISDASVMIDHLFISSAPLMVGCE